MQLVIAYAGIAVFPTLWLKSKNVLNLQPNIMHGRNPAGLH
jgi:hypothetical protein